MTTNNLHGWALCITVLIGFSSCQKDLALEPEQLEIDQKRVRTVSSPLSLKAQLGKKIYFDNTLSEPVGLQSCSSCHLPDQGFAGKGSVAPSNSPSAPRGFIAGIAEGAVSGAYGGRKPPSASYATFSPVFSLNGEEFQGGLFWDGRATGLRLGKPAAEQALGPFLAGVEQNHPSKEAVLLKLINNSEYTALWRSVWGSDINISNQALIEQNYDKVGFSIAEFEASSEVNQFTSKYDLYLSKKAELSAIEKQGLSLFNGKAKCDKCHESDAKNNLPPMFTDFGYENIGLPSNTEFLGTLRRGASPDYGLGAELINSPNPQWRNLATVNMGKFRTPTLRNVAKGENNKRYMHNGVLKSLEEVVHFYNTRDTDPKWATPEVLANLEVDDLGNLGLTPSEELAIVAFLRTLSDGWSSSPTNINRGL